MKKIYLLLTALLAVFTTANAQVIITELADPNNDATARYVELYVVGPNDVDMTGWSLIRYTNANTMSTSSIDLSSLGNATVGTFVTIAANGAAFQAAYGLAPTISASTGGPADSNGDDNIELLDAMGNVVDVFGVPGEDGSGTCHEFEDGRAERAPSVTAPAAVWNEAEWIVRADSTVSGCTSHTNNPASAPADYDPGAWIGATMGTDPVINITAPGNNAVLASGTTSATVSFTVQNFTPSSAAGQTDGDGYVQYSQDGVNFTDQYNTNDINIANLNDGDTVTLIVQLVDNNGQQFQNTNAVDTVTFSVDAVIVVNDVATMASLADGANFNFTGTATVTQVTADRNQIFLEDATGAILIDDPAMFNTVTFSIGDEISNFTGTRSNFNSTKQINLTSQPTNSGPAQAPVSPQVLTIADLNNDDQTMNPVYQSELVQLQNVFFTGVMAGDQFAENTNYTLTDGTDSITLRIPFNDSPFIGTDIPLGPGNMTVLVTAFNANAQVTPRELSDSTLNVPTVNNVQFAVYPNPSNGEFTIAASNGNAVNVEVMNTLGQVVATRNDVTGAINLDLNTGVYIARISQDGAVVTQRIVIK